MQFRMNRKTLTEKRMRLSLFKPIQISYLNSNLSRILFPLICRCLFVLFYVLTFVILSVVWVARSLFYLLPIAHNYFLLLLLLLFCLIVVLCAFFCALVYDYINIESITTTTNITLFREQSCSISSDLRNLPSSNEIWFHLCIGTLNTRNCAYY